LLVCAAQFEAKFMKLLPLIDRTGAVAAWADRKTGWTCNPTGNVFLLIAFDGVFRSTGEQVGWFYGDHIRNRNGQVVLSRPNVKIEGLTMPRWKKIPPPPKIRMPPRRPELRWLLMSLFNRPYAWADVRSLFDGLSRVRAFEEQLRKLV
jgi:hypothetical protein